MNNSMLSRQKENFKFNASSGQVYITISSHNALVVSLYLKHSSGYTAT